MQALRPQFRPLLCRQRRMSRHQSTGFGQRSIGQCDAGRTGQQQRAEYPGGGPAGANQQQMAPAQANSGIAFNVLDQTGAVGVVRHQLAILQGQYIGCTCQCGTLRLMVGQRSCLKLEGHRDIATMPALRKEGLHFGGKPIEGNKPAVVVQCLSGKFSKASVNPRRLAVLDRIAHDAVEIHRCSGWSLVQRGFSLS